MKQEELAAAFERGETSGVASNVHIHENGDGSTLLVGFGHAVYARRDQFGEILVFEGWTYKAHPIRPNAGTQSTKIQYARMGLRDMADKVIRDKGPIGAPKLRASARLKGITA